MVLTVPVLFVGNAAAKHMQFFARLHMRSNYSIYLPKSPSFIFLMVSIIRRIAHFPSITKSVISLHFFHTDKQNHRLDYLLGLKTKKFNVPHHLSLDAHMLLL